MQVWFVELWVYVLFQLCTASHSQSKLTSTPGSYPVLYCWPLGQWCFLVRRQILSHQKHTHTNTQTQLVVIWSFINYQSAPLSKEKSIVLQSEVSMLSLCKIMDWFNARRKIIHPPTAIFRQTYFIFKSILSLFFDPFHQQLFFNSTLIYVWTF